jgi:hypothetical protein
MSDDEEKVTHQRQPARGQQILPELPQSQKPWGAQGDELHLRGQSHGDRDLSSYFPAAVHLHAFD